MYTERPLDSLSVLDEEEIRRFKALEDIQVVFDVGAKTNLDYLELKPSVELHLFEVNPVYCKWLEENTKGKNVFINCYGLGEKEKTATYNYKLEQLSGNEPGLREENGAPFSQIKTLDWYIQQNNITRIDFLKIDAEGYDLQILQGGTEAIKLCKYIQYEYWEDRGKFHELLQHDFLIEDIGKRNVFCTRKGINQ